MSRYPPSRVVAAAAASAALILAAGMALAVSGFDMHSEATQVVQRQVVWVGSPSQTTPRAIRISSESVGAPSPDAFQITYADGSFLLEYQRHVDAPATSAFNLTVRSLLEWNDTNANGVLDDATGEMEFPLADAGFGNQPIRHSAGLTPDGGDIQSFVIVSDNREVSLNLTIAERIIQVSPVQRLTPMEAKLSIEIQHHLVHPGWQVGLEIGIQTPDRVRLENTSWDDDHAFSQDDRSLSLTNASMAETSSTFFAWSNTSTVNGVTRPVMVEGPHANESTPGYYDMVLAYPDDSVPLGADVHVVHDPTLGVVSGAYESLPILPIVNPNLQGDVALYAASLVLVAGLVSATILLAGRRRRT